MAHPAPGQPGTTVWADGVDAALAALGNAATKNVGTTSGTVAAGNDSRFSGGGGGGGGPETVNTVAVSGAAQTIPSPSTASMSRITLTANCVLTFPTLAAGESFTLSLIQGTPGSRHVTWPSAVKWPGGVVPTLSVATNARDVLAFVCDDGSTWAGFMSGQDMR